jgi:hypothetical protein
MMSCNKAHFDKLQHNFDKLQQNPLWGVRRIWQFGIRLALINYNKTLTCATIQLTLTSCNKTPINCSPLWWATTKLWHELQ